MQPDKKNTSGDAHTQEFRRGFRPTARKFSVRRWDRSLLLTPSSIARGLDSFRTETLNHYMPDKRERSKRLDPILAFGDVGQSVRSQAISLGTITRKQMPGGQTHNHPSHYNITK